MNTINDLEPGIVKNFRLFIGVRLALIINSLLGLIILTGYQFAKDFVFLIVIVLIDAVFLFIYLSIPKLLGVFKKFYLPIAIVWATLGPILQFYLGFLYTKTDTFLILTYFMTPLPFLVMFIPLVIVAWQYNQRYVLYFCVITFLFDFIFSLEVFTVSISAFITITTITIIRTILFFIVGNMITNLMNIQREQREQLIEVNDRLVHYSITMEQLTISRERNRMARELHDLIAHTMSGVAIELEGVRATLTVKPEQAHDLLDHSLRAIREGLTETRRAVKALRSSPLEDLGLGLSICNLVDTLPNRLSYKIDMQIENNIEEFSIEVEHCFYRIAQEALNNIASHAQATAINVNLSQEGNILKMSIKDNGIGFDVKSINQEDKFGLLGMKERAEMIGGILNIVSHPKQGTKIELIYGGRL